ncbi:unnamed protein product [Malus baccata var. baccata]
MEIGNPSRFGSRQLPSTLPTPSTVSVKFYNGVSSSLSLLRATPRVRTLRCSALSSASLDVVHTVVALGEFLSGNMDIALALRTIVFPTSFRYDTMYSYKDANKRREWVAHLQAGARIVADSDPADEQRECENKPAALARAIDLAESLFVDN